MIIHPYATPTLWSNFPPFGYKNWSRNSSAKNPSHSALSWLTSLAPTEWLLWNNTRYDNVGKEPFFAFSFHPSISKTTALDFFSLLFCLDFGDLFSWFDTISSVTISDVFSWLLSDKTVGGVWTLACSLGTVFGRLFLSFFTTVIRAPETGVSMASLKFCNFTITIGYIWSVWK